MPPRRESRFVAGKSNLSGKFIHGTEQDEKEKKYLGEAVRSLEDVLAVSGDGEFRKGGRVHLRENSAYGPDFDEELTSPLPTNVSAAQPGGASEVGGL